MTTAESDSATSRTSPAVSELKSTMHCLHVLYSGRAEGGAQEFAYRLAAELGFHTYSIRAGNIQQRMQASGWTAIDKESLLEEHYSKVVLSDLRALLWWVLQRKVSGKTVYFVPHNDKLNKLAVIVKAIAYFAKITVLPTTRRQALALTSRNQFFYLKKPDRAMKISKRKQKKIAYWGRFGKEKRLNYLVSIFRKSGLANMGWTLMIIGDGAHPPDEDVEGVIVKRAWLDAIQVRNLVEDCAFSINMRRQEGISLMALESLSLGVVPLFYSRETASNYYHASEFIPVKSSKALLRAVCKTYEDTDVTLQRFYSGASDIIGEISAL